MNVISIKKDQEYLTLIEQLEEQIQANDKLIKGREQEVGRSITEVELALHELVGNKRFDKATYLKLKLQQ
ncbi:MAG: hypothetical protein CMD31_13215 [Flavobacteriales bacterium]|nr:hypothetical protein [Flavobacteriales bacterium]|tara:strand:- start:3730 stop:3939 length:210 start_codon:yes stop_codon:yes gene_type:complete